MMCPYRVSVHKKIYTEEDGSKIIKEQVSYEDCYRDLCPFFVDSVSFAEPFCGRAYNELGGEM